MSQKLEQAKQFVRQGNKKAARQLLSEIIKSNPEDDLAWLWMAATVEKREAQQECLERALRLIRHQAALWVVEIKEDDGSRAESLRPHPADGPSKDLDPASTTRLRKGKVSPSLNCRVNHGVISMVIHLWIGVITGGWIVWQRYFGVVVVWQPNCVQME
jgi:hypothetical protein